MARPHLFNDHRGLPLLSAQGAVSAVKAQTVEEGQLQTSQLSAVRNNQSRQNFCCVFHIMGVENSLSNA